VNADDFSPAGRKQIVTIFGALDIDLPYITLGEEFMWLCYRCFVSRGQESIPLFGQYGLTTQLGDRSNIRVPALPGDVGSVAGSGSSNLAGMSGADQWRWSVDED